MVGKKKLARETITTENIQKHRRAILKNGRKFKFPVQYLQHRVITNTIIIGLTVILLTTGVSLWQLYLMQNTGDVLYGITRIVPLPVAKIDGYTVLFKDYLALYRSSIAVVERQEGEITNDAENTERLKAYRRAALDTALENGYALGLADQMDISISKAEIDEYLVWQRSNTGTEVSEASFGKIIRDNYNLSLAEYKRLFIELPLIRAKVAEKVDIEAPFLLEQIDTSVKAGKNLQDIANEIGDKVLFEDSGGEVSTLNLDGGRATKANQQTVGQTSAAFLSRAGDAYYFVKTTAKSDGRVAYESLKVPLTTFSERFRQIIDEGKVEEYIELK